MKRFSFSFLALLLCLSGAPTAFAASEGPNVAGTGANDETVGVAVWTNPENATADDGSFASGDATNQTNYLKATNFGFAIPSGATINGIVLTVQRYPYPDANVRDQSIRLVKGGSITGDNKGDGVTNWTGDDEFPATVTFGDASDTWGMTLTAEDVNASTFGVVMSAGNGCSGICFNRSASIDYVALTVHYTAAATIETSTTRGAARTRLLRRRSNPTFSDTEAPSLSEVGIFVPEPNDADPPSSAAADSGRAGEREEHPSAAAGESSEPPILLEEEVCTRFEQYRAHDSVWRRLQKRLNKWFGGECG